MTPFAFYSVRFCRAGSARHAVQSPAHPHRPNCRERSAPAGQDI